VIGCTFEDGHAASLRHVVVDGLVVKNERLLLTRRAGSLIEGGKLSLPGGYVERDETIFEAMRRELLEETGYETMDVTLFNVISTPRRGPDDRQNISMLMLVEPGEVVGQSDWEVSEMGWYPFGELPPLDSLAFDHGDLVRGFLASER
jgi:8-oxo-dGTP diphosphatase